MLKKGYQIAFCSISYLYIRNEHKKGFKMSYNNLEKTSWIKSYSTMKLWFVVFFNDFHQKLESLKAKIKCEIEQNYNIIIYIRNPHIIS